MCIINCRVSTEDFNDKMRHCSVSALFVFFALFTIDVQGRHQGELFEASADGAQNLPSFTLRNSPTAVPKCPHLPASSNTKASLTLTKDAFPSELLLKRSFYLPANPPQYSVPPLTHRTIFSLGELRLLEKLSNPHPPPPKTMTTKELRNNPRRGAANRRSALKVSSLLTPRLTSSLCPSSARTRTAPVPRKSASAKTGKAWRCTPSPAFETSFLNARETWRQRAFLIVHRKGELGAVLQRQGPRAPVQSKPGPTWTT